MNISCKIVCIGLLGLMGLLQAVSGDDDPVGTQGETTQTGDAGTAYGPRRGQDSGQDTGNIPDRYRFRRQPVVNTPAKPQSADTTRVKSAVSDISAKLSGAQDAIQDVLDRAQVKVQQLGQGFARQVNNLAQTAQTALDKITVVSKTSRWSLIKKDISDAVDAIIALFKSVKDYIVDSSASAYKNIQAALTQLKRKLARTTIKLNQQGPTIKTKANPVLDVRDALQDLSNQASDLVNSLGKTVKKALAEITR